MNTSAGIALRRSLALAMMAAVCLTSCDNGNERESGSVRTIAPSPSVSLSPGALEGEEIVIETRIVGFDGKVLTGSVLGGEAFCPGGTVHHEHGSPQIGFPAVNVFSCQAGLLSIGFGPGPDQMEQSVQTSDWQVLEGTDGFAGSTGEGTMRVEFEEGENLIGRETFSGLLVVP